MRQLIATLSLPFKGGVGETYNYHPSEEEHVPRSMLSGNTSYPIGSFGKDLRAKRGNAYTFTPITHQQPIPSSIRCVMPQGRSQANQISVSLTKDRSTHETRIFGLYARAKFEFFHTKGRSQGSATTSRTNERDPRDLLDHTRISKTHAQGRRTINTPLSLHLPPLMHGQVGVRGRSWRVRPPQKGRDGGRNTS